MIVLALVEGKIYQFVFVAAGGCEEMLGLIFAILVGETQKLTPFILFELEPSSKKLIGFDSKFLISMKQIR